MLSQNDYDKIFERLRILETFSGGPGHNTLEKLEIDFRQICGTLANEYYFFPGDTTIKTRSIVVGHAILGLLKKKFTKTRLDYKVALSCSHEPYIDGCIIILALEGSGTPPEVSSPGRHAFGIEACRAML